MKRIIAITALALAAATAALTSAQAQAQNNDIIASGRVVMAPYFDASHRLLLSMSEPTHGTARSAAMGGAFASLGADLSSININPAGLGMYQRSDWGISQSVSINRMKTSSKYMPSGNLVSGGNRTSYGLDNVGIAFNLFNRSKGLTSLTLGISYNRAANFNSRSFIETESERASIAGMFRNQMELMANAGISDFNLENTAISPDNWGAVMGWNSDLVDEDTNTGAFTVSNDFIPNNSRFGSTTRGGLYEYGFSMGANINNVLYLGVTLGATQVNYKESTTYEEFYSGGPIREMWYDQSTDLSGWGFSAKLGAIVRPFPALRIGAAFHLPTYFTVQKSYSAAMGAGANLYEPDVKIVDKQKFDTAPKLLAGISVILGQRAVIAADYELAWYDKIVRRGVKESDIERSRNESAFLYKPAHTVRAGLEIRASDFVSLRVGGGYNFDFMRQRDFVTNNPTPRSGYTVTAGLGFNIWKNGYIDIAYVYNKRNYTDYELYYHEADFSDGRKVVSQYDTVDGVDHDRTYTPLKELHQITLTFGSRF